MFNSYRLRFLIFPQAISSSIANVGTQYAIEWIRTTRLTTFASTALKLIVGTNAIYFVRFIATVGCSIADIGIFNTSRVGCRRCGAGEISAAVAIEMPTAAINMTPV